MSTSQGPRSGGSGPPHPREQARPCLADVLDTVPQIFDLVPATSALSVGRTSWGCLLALMRHGRTTAVGDVEWRRLASLSYSDTCLEVVTEARPSIPVLDLRAPHGALLRGLARRVEPGSRYVGQLDFSGGSFDLTQAAALRSAARRAGLRDEDVASRAKRWRALVRMLQLPAEQGAPPLRVIGLRVQPWQLDATPEILQAPAVVEHVKELTLAVSQARQPCPTSLEDNDAWKETGGRMRTLEACLKLGTAGALAIAELVRKSPTLRELDMTWTWCDDETGMAAIAEAAFTSGTLAALRCPSALNRCFTDAANRHGCGSLERLRMTARGFSNAPRLLLPAHPPNLKVMSLSDLSDDDLPSLTAMLQHGTALHTLRLVLRAVHREEAHLFSQHLQQVLQPVASKPGLPLQLLDLRDTCVSSPTGLALMATLARTPSLRVLTLAGSNVCDNAALSLADALAGNTTLRELDVSDNNVGTAAIDRLLRAVGRSKIEVFLMEGNWSYDIGEEEIPTTMSDILTGNSTLRTLKIGRAIPSLDIDDDEAPPVGWSLLGLESFAQGVATHPALRVLSLGGFCLDTDGALSLARAVRRSTSLRSLVLESAHISDACGAQLAEELSFNTGLLHVSLVDNPGMRKLTAAALYRALQRHPTLKMLDVKHCGFENNRYWTTRVRQVGMPHPRILVRNDGTSGPDAQ